MENVNTAKLGLLTIMGAIGAFISSLFEGQDAALTTLVIFMAANYITGLVVAGVLKKSGKSENGNLKSRAGWKGLCRKGMTLLIVLVAVRLELAIDTSFLKDAVVIAYIVNETISIIENAGLMGLPIPSVIQKAIDVLQKQTEGDANANH